MPDVQTSPLDTTRLAKLPRRPELVIEGGKRPLGLYSRDGQKTFQPHVALWVEPASGVVRAHSVINPLRSPDDGVSEALASLIDAIVEPASATPAPSPFLALEGPSSLVQAPALGAPAANKARRGLPGRVRVNDPALARAASALLAPFGVTVDQAGELPAFTEAYESLAAFMGADEDPEMLAPFAWDVAPASIEPLYKAAARYTRRRPWELLLDHPPLAVELGADGPAPGVETLYAAILGAGDEVFGVAFYYGREAYERTIESDAGRALDPDDERIDGAIAELRRMGAPVDGVPPSLLRAMVADLGLPLLIDGEEGPGAMAEAMEDCLTLFLDEESEVDPTYLDWLDEHGVKVSRRNVPTFTRTVKGGEFRQPDEREVRALTLALEGVNGFVGAHKDALSSTVSPGTLTHTTRVGTRASRRDITVTVPAPGFAWEDADGTPLVPPSPAAATTLYRFQVKLDWMKSVWRRIELRGDQTLDDLHDAIQAAFGWDDDHLYAFFLSGKAWDENSEYGSPYSPDSSRNAARYPLEALPLRTGKSILYIFDFGDELRHQVKLEAIVPDGARPGVDYPRIAEGRGDPPPQYPAFQE